MDLRKVLSEDVIRMHLKGDTKKEIIESLLDILMETGKVRNRELALNSIMEREKKMSTGIENGVAIPHGKTDAVDSLLVCVALKREGADFESLDGKPSRIFIMTLSPLNKSGPHVQFLTEISRLLKDSESRERILSSESAEEVLDIILY